MVKTEGSPAPATPATYPTWNTTQVPIDPALQTSTQQTPSTPYGHYQAYSHYPTSYAAQQYQQYTANAQTATPTASQSQGASSSSKQDNSDVDALKDAIGSTGVDLRAEEESLQRSHDNSQAYRHQEDRTRKQPAKPSFDARFLGTTMRAIGTEHKVTQVPEDSVTYLALALRARLQGLIEAMIAASAHRTDTQFDRPASLYPDGTPMWGIVIRSDIGKQLAALEKVEREEEQRVRRERKERADAQAAQVSALEAAAAGDGYDEDGAPKKKKKKEGPGVTARNMSEDIRKKISNATASQAAGLSTAKYSWMTGGVNAAATPKAKSAATTTPAAAATPATPTPVTNSWAKPYVSATKPAPAPAAPEDPRRKVTLRDALFVIEKEKGHGGGRGSARGWV